MFETKGAVVVEADRLGHEVIEPGGEAFEEVARRWPAAVRDRRIDRRLLAAIVFDDPAELVALESVTHPYIARRVEGAAAAAGDDAVVVVEMPLTANLMGPGWHRLVVLAPDEVRRARAVARGMDESDVRRRMAAQAPYDVWEASADSVIVNDGDLVELGRCVDRWWRAHILGV